MDPKKMCYEWKKIEDQKPENLEETFLVTVKYQDEFGNIKVKFDCDTWFQRIKENKYSWDFKRYSHTYPSLELGVILSFTKI